MPVAAAMARKTYKGLVEFVGENGIKTIGNNTLAETHVDDGEVWVSIRLHGHIIIEMGPKEIWISNAGHKTNLTKSRLNIFLEDYNACVFQKDHKWFIKDGSRIRDFNPDGFTIVRRG